MPLFSCGISSICIWEVLQKRCTHIREAIFLKFVCWNSICFICNLHAKFKKILIFNKNKLLDRFFSSPEQHQSTKTVNFPTLRFVNFIRTTPILVNSLHSLSSSAGFITVPFDKPGYSCIPDCFAFVYEFWRTFPGTTGFYHGFAQGELAVASCTSLGIEGV